MEARFGRNEARFGRIEARLGGTEARLGAWDHRGMSDSQGVESASHVKWNAEGLVPAIVQQHDTGEVLMLAWVDDDDLVGVLGGGEPVGDRDRRPA